jgi:hypothetical protein
MLNDAAGFKRIFIAAGYTDLRRGLDGLSGIVQYQFEQLMKGFEIIAKRPIKPQDNPLLLSSTKNVRHIR